MAIQQQQQAPDFVTWLMNTLGPYMMQGQTPVQFEASAPPGGTFSTGSGYEDTGNMDFGIPYPDASQNSAPAIPLPELTGGQTPGQNILAPWQATQPATQSAAMATQRMMTPQTAMPQAAPVADPAAAGFNPMGFVQQLFQGMGGGNPVDPSALGPQRPNMTMGTPSMPDPAQLAGPILDAIMRRMGAGGGPAAMAQPGAVTPATVTPGQLAPPAQGGVTPATVTPGQLAPPAAPIPRPASERPQPKAAPKKKKKKKASAGSDNNDSRKKESREDVLRRRRERFGQAQSLTG